MLLWWNRSTQFKERFPYSILYDNYIFCSKLKDTHEVFSTVIDMYISMFISKGLIKYCVSLNIRKKNKSKIMGFYKFFLNKKFKNVFHGVPCTFHVTKWKKVFVSPSKVLIKKDLSIFIIMFLLEFHYIMEYSVWYNLG